MYVLSGPFRINNASIDLLLLPWQICLNMLVYGCDMQWCTERRGEIQRKENCTAVLSWMSCQPIGLNETFWFQFIPPVFLKVTYFIFTHLMAEIITSLVSATNQFKLWIFCNLLSSSWYMTWYILRNDFTSNNFSWAAQANICYLAMMGMLLVCRYLVMNQSIWTKLNVDKSQEIKVIS